MAGSRRAGFTIVEISLFLGLTGLLFLIAILGTGNAIRTFRFTDSGRSLETFAQKQYDDIVNGLNSRSDTVSCSGGVIDTSASQTVGSSDCLQMGKLLVFSLNDPTVTIYPVIGTEPANINYSLSDDSLITAFSPKTVTTTAVSSYTIPWGAKPSGFKRTTDNQATNAVLLIRSPKSSRVVSYTFKVTPAAPPSDLTSTVAAAANRAKVTNLCIKSADGLGSPAKLVISGGASQSAASVVFNSVDTECNGV